MSKMREAVAKSLIGNQDFISLFEYLEELAMDKVIHLDLGEVDKRNHAVQYVRALRDVMDDIRTISEGDSEFKVRAGLDFNRDAYTTLSEERNGH